MKEIVIIGSGNLAESLAVAVAAAPQLHLVQLFARNESRGREVAALARTVWCGEAEGLARAELYLIAVSDRAVAEVAAQLPIPADAAVAHTAGCVPLDVLPYARRAVFYPMQTFTRGRRVDFAEIPIFIEASTPDLCDELEACARNLSRRVLRSDSAQRARIHLAAVFACNFTNHMYVLGERIAREAGLDFEVLKPLVMETARKACDAASPADVQTGPAVRGDQSTQQRHLSLLDGNETLQEIYKLISKDIWETSRKI